MYNVYLYMYVHDLAQQTEIKKIMNDTVIRKSMLDREYLLLCPTVKLKYALN